MTGKPAFAPDYIQVHERIAAFYAKHPEGSLQAEIVDLSDHLVVMRAYAYRTAADERPGIGYSSLGIPGATPYTRGSEIENCETSAWGRAIAALGFEVKRGIATAEEVRNKEGDATVPDDGPVTITGISSAGKSAPVDLEYRQGPPEQGDTLGFVVVDKDRGWRTQVVAVGELATALWDSIAHEGARLHNVEVTVTGVMGRIAWKKDGKAMPAYRRMTLERIVTPEFTLPADLPPVVEDDLSDLPEFAVPA